MFGSIRIISKIMFDKFLTLYLINDVFQLFVLNSKFENIL